MRTSCFCTILAMAAGAVLAPRGFSGEVAESWIDRLDGPASMNDYGEAVAIDADGSVYVAGFVFQQVSSGLFAPRFMTARYAVDGSRLWTRTYAGNFASGAAAAYHLAIDGGGNIVVSGSTNQGDDWAVVKYDSKGTELWRSVYQADSSFLTQPDDMALDAEGNIYLVGDVGSFSGPDAGALVKFSPSGIQEFVRQYSGPTSGGAGFNAVAVDGTGNIYAAGSAVVPMLASEMAVVKYDAEGTLQWVATDGGSGPFTHDRASEVGLDSTGDVIVVGAFGFNTLAGVDLAVARYAPSGDQLWRELYAAPAGGDDAPTDMAITSTDEIVAVGYSGVGEGDYDALTLKFDSTGSLLWEQRVAGDEIHFDWASSVDLDDNDNIYVAGVYDPIGGSRYFAVRYDPDGAERWFMDYAGPMGGGSAARAIAAGPDGSVAVTGESPDPATEFDIATIRYQQGAEQIPGDLDGDGTVGFADLVWVLSAWGACPPPHEECPADIDGDGVVGFSDLIILLANWT